MDILYYTSRIMKRIIKMFHVKHFDNCKTVKCNDKNNVSRETLGRLLFEKVV